MRLTPDLVCCELLTQFVGIRADGIAGLNLRLSLVKPINQIINICQQLDERKNYNHDVANDLFTKILKKI